MPNMLSSWNNDIIIIIIIIIITTDVFWATLSFCLVQVT